MAAATATTLRGGRDRLRGPALAWAVLGLAAFAVLPWFLDAGAGSGLRAASSHWPTLWIAPIALAVAAATVWLSRTARRAPAASDGPVRVDAAARPRERTRAASGLVVAMAALGLALLLGFAWTLKQPGYGAGGAGVLVALLMLAACGLAGLGLFRGDVFVAGAVVLCGALLAVFVAWPVLVALGSAFVDDAGRPSLAALTERIGGERTWGLGCVAGGARCGVAWNTLLLAVLTGAGTTVLGTAIALAGERSARRLKKPIALLSLLPIITPPFVVGLGLILLFGRAGLVNQALESMFGIAPTRWFYGLPGLLLAQLFAFTPIAVLIVRGVVAGIAPSLEEAAQMLGADRRRAFLTVTLPLLRPGLANAFLVGFIESIADFGNPVVVGGSYAVLSTDVFFAVVGAQLDAGRAAALALLLTLFALVVFALQQKVVGRVRYTTVAGKGDAGVPMRLPKGLSRAVLALVVPWLGFTLVVYAFAFAGGFVSVWGRDWTPTLAHFRTAFDVQSGAGGIVWAGTAWNSLFNTLELAAAAAPLTAALGLTIAWLLARTRFAGRRAFEFAALVAFAIPGTVLGVSYVFVFNVPPFELTGTALVIVLCFVFRSLPVGVRAGSASFAQIDGSLDEASAMLHSRTSQTIGRVVLPLIKPAIVAALVYSFVRSMTTVSAVIFLVTAENELATTYIIGRVGNGDYGVALAYCTVLIVLMSIAVAAIQRLVGERRLGRRDTAATSP